MGIDGLGTENATARGGKLGSECVKDMSQSIDQAGRVNSRRNTSLMRKI